MNPLATELNDAIRRKNSPVFDMLSTLGKEMFFPKGILSQSAEAKQKAKKFNATLGVATERGHMMSLPSLMSQLGGMTADDVLNYAPVAGLAELRAAWKQKVLKDNPTLARDKKPMSLPIVTNGLTHGLSLMADLFCEPGDVILLPDQIWGNYRLTFVTRRGGQIATYPFYSPQGGFNCAGFAEALEKARQGRQKVIVLLNFPNNPTGYSPTRDEGRRIADALIAAASGGTNVVAIVDDAYYGLFYEPDVMTESLFSLLAGANERLLAVKCDAATKEVFVWGLRIGFISFGVAGAAEGDEVCQALEKKVCGAIRGVLSNCSMLSQRVVLKALQSPTFYEERKARKDLLGSRAVEVKRVLADKKFDAAWESYRFNSGYFMCLKLKKAKAEDLRKHLLDKYGVGTIATAERDLRIAFSCVEKENIREVFDIIYQAACDLA